MSSSVFFGNLSWNLDVEQLIEVVSEIAEPTKVEIMRNKYGKSLGYAIGSFESAEQAQAVMERLNGEEIDGRTMNVREDRGARVKAQPQTSSNRVYVGNLSWDTTDEHLLEVFGEFNVVDASVQRQNRGRSKGWALVEFSTADEAEAAISSVNGAEVDGRNVVCRSDRGARAAPERNQPKPKAEKSESVFMGNLSWDVDDEILHQTLGDQGFDFVEAGVQLRADGKSRGFALVTFASIEEAERAVKELNKVEVLGREMLVKFDGM